MCLVFCYFKIMNGIATQEEHVAQQHPHVQKHLLLARHVVVFTTLVDIHHIAIGDQAVLKLREPPGGPEGGIEEERHWRIVVLVHRLIEKLGALKVGYHHREVEILREDAPVRVALPVALTIAMIVIVLYGVALRLHQAASHLCHIVTIEDGLQIFRMISFHKKSDIKSVTFCNVRYCKINDFYRDLACYTRPFIIF